MFKFLNVPERITCRFDNQNHPIAAKIEGLYTDNFGMCNIFILYQRNGDHVKSSMTHADQVVNPEQIQQEINWINSSGPEFSFYIIAKDNSKSLSIREKILRNLFVSITPVIFYTQNYAISINQDNVIEYYERSNIPKLATHPQEWSLYSYFELNLAFTHYQPVIERRFTQPNFDMLENTGLLFDGYVWKDLSCHDQQLVPLALEFYNYFCSEMDKHTSASLEVASECVRSYFSTFSMKEGEDENDLHRTSTLLIANCSLILLKRNDYKTILQNEISNVIDAANEHDTAIINQFKRIIETDLSWPRDAQNILIFLERQDFAQTLGRTFNHCRRFKIHDAPFDITVSTTTTIETVTATCAGMYSAPRKQQAQKKSTIGSGFKKGFLLGK